jgi:hypothetical protein
MILSDSFFQEFDILLKEIEKNYVSERNLVKIKGNKFAMIGNTYLITYPNLKKIKSFQKELQQLWGHFNSLHPQTHWRGK